MPRKILRNGFNRRSFFTGATRAGRCGLALVAAGLIGAARAQSPVTFAADKSGQINFVTPSQNV